MTPLTLFPATAAPAGRTAARPEAQDGEARHLDVPSALRILAGGSALAEWEARSVFGEIMGGGATPAQIGALLMAMRVRGETLDEIVGAARAMRERMVVVDAPEGAVDVCGTGGDGAGTFNISTTVAFVVAACGVPVAKHCNRAMSSKSGAADVLEALGLRLDAPFEAVARAIREVGVGFLFAPRHHSAMRHVGPSRRELGVRTLFNLVGPISSPARARRQLLGVFDRAWVEPMAQALAALGSERAWVVHGEDGLDELTTTGSSTVAELRDGSVRRLTITPEQVGLRRARSEDLAGGDATENAGLLRAVLAGKQGPHRDIVLLNAAAALLVAGRAGTLAEGCALAGEAVDAGAAAGKLDALVRVMEGAA